MTFKWNSWRFDSEITIQPETPLDHGTATGPLPLAPDRSQKEPLRGKFERTTHLWHQRAPWAMEIKSNINPSTQGESPWIIGEWVTWENTFMPMFFGWKTNYLNIYRYIIPFWLKDNLFESLNHDSLQCQDQTNPAEERLKNQPQDIEEQSDFLRMNMSSESWKTSTCPQLKETNITISSQKWVWKTMFFILLLWTVCFFGDDSLIAPTSHHSLSDIGH